MSRLQTNRGTALRVARRIAPLAMGTGVFVLVACVHAAAQKGAMPTDPIPVTPYVVVTIDKSSLDITVEPKVAFVRPGGSLEYRVVDLPADYTLEIDYKVEGKYKGPFLQDEKKAEPRGRTTLRPGVDRVTLRYDPDLRETTVWKYEIALRDGNKVDKKVIDPMTIGKGDN